MSTSPSEQHVLALILFYNDLTHEEFLDLPEEERDAFYEDAEELINSQDYFVGDYEESITKMKECIDNYYQNVIEPEVEKITNGQSPIDPFAYYLKFDYEMWFRDMQMGGMGERIASYDSEEHIIEVDGTIFYIFRIN